MAKKTFVRGRCCLVEGMAGEDVEDGALLYDVRNRSAWRKVCRDGGEAVLRNLRAPDVVEAVTPASLAAHYRRLEAQR